MTKENQRKKYLWITLTLNITLSKTTYKDLGTNVAENNLNMEKPNSQNHLVYKATIQT